MSILPSAHFTEEESRGLDEGNDWLTLVASI